MGLVHLAYASPLYRLLLLGSRPRTITVSPPRLIPGDRARGERILAGTLHCRSGRRITIEPPQWSGDDLSASEQDELHSFDWLNDVAAVPGPQAAEAGRKLIGSWIAEHQRWSPQPWAPPTLGNRISAWLTNADFVTSADGDFKMRLLSSLARQVRHLGFVTQRGVEGSHRFRVLRGLVYGGACGFTSKHRLDAAIRRVEREIGRQILVDGGHVSRSPAEHVDVLKSLIEIDATLLAAQRKPSSDVQTTIERMRRVVRLLCHGDGQLAQFNGSTDGGASLISAVLGGAKNSARPEESPRRMGFERLAAASTVLIVDVGPPPPAGFDLRAHAGALSFEMSSGTERLIVNCGASVSEDRQWHSAQRATAAHSTLTVDDTNSSEVIEFGGIGPRRAGVDSTRQSANGDAWLDASHDGYLTNFGLIHRRRLYLSADGLDVRGEDTLTGGHQGTFAIRFHLHPAVRASVVQNGVAVLMRMPSGRLWRLQASGAGCSVMDSVYLGGDGRRRSEAVVLTGNLSGEGAQVKWAIKETRVSDSPR